MASENHIFNDSSKEVGDSLQEPLHLIEKEELNQDDAPRYKSEFLVVCRLILIGSSLIYSGYSWVLYNQIFDKVAPLYKWDKDFISFM